MISLEHQCVSLELAKRLKELGVKQESLFLWCEDTQPATLWSLDRWEGSILSSRDSDDNLFSAFTVAELGEMLPIGFSCSRFDSEEGRWRGMWGLENYFEADTEADARAKMLIYLVENGLYIMKT